MHRNDFVRNLILMAAADGSLSESEIGFLAERCDRFGIGEAEFAELIERAIAERDDAQIKIPDSKEECLFLLGELIRAMAADGVLAPAEKNLFANAAGRMKLSVDELNELIDEVLADDEV